MSLGGRSLGGGGGRPVEIQEGLLPPAASLASDMGVAKTRLLIACSGSVASIKLPNMLQAFARYPNLSVRVVLTPSAARFLDGQSAEQPGLLQIRRMPNVDAIYRDEDEWAVPWVRSASILHIELRRYAPALPVSAFAPASVPTPRGHPFLRVSREARPSRINETHIDGPTCW